LDGLSLRAGEQFHVDLHLFTVRHRIQEHIQSAFSQFETSGFGVHRSRAILERVVGPSPVALSLDPLRAGITHARVEFQSPTELKHGGSIVEQPRFDVLFSRLCTRLATLQGLYGDEPLNIDFSELQQKARRIALKEHTLRHCQKERRSSRTGQIHPLGGFIGFAEYGGDFDSLLPYLRAARWTGVGRQTVWGKGEIEVRFPPDLFS
jgi:CRISPR-associated endoribonuclease Cas6